MMISASSKGGGVVARCVTAASKSRIILLSRTEHTYVRFSAV